MYEILKKQFSNGKTLTENKYYSVVSREHWPKFHWDLYPLAHEYYHELNPYFLYNIYRNDFFKFAKVYTARDGYVTFATFILNNIANFNKLEAQLIMIHPSLAPLVPPNLAQYFASWNIVQKKQLSLKEAKKIIVFGFVCEQNLGSLEKVEEKIRALKNIDPEIPLDLILPIRKNVLDTNHKETVLIHSLMDLIRTTLGSRKIQIHTMEHLLEMTHFKDTYIIDLALDNFYVSDNYLHYYLQSRGATVNNSSLLTAPSDSVFSLEMSFNHELHISPLPKCENFFIDLIMYKKQHATIKDFNFDPVFQGMLKEFFRKES